MAEKTLNTRFQLPYDTYTNWSTKNPKLKKGEMVQVEVPAPKDAIVQAPSVLIKVGDGIHNFNDLAWTSGLAADIYDWAKAATKPSYNTSELTNDSGFVTQTTLNTGLNAKLDKADAGSDWNQNDSTQPDYVKNRPFYEETETTSILESQQIDFSQSFRIPTSIVKGNTYLITWDGTDYTITATEKEIIAGEIYIPYLEQADGLFSIEDMTMRAADNGIHTVAISLVDSTIKTIDEKFIPNTIARNNKVVKHIFNIYPNEDGAINEISYDNLSDKPPIYHAYKGLGSVSLNTLYNHTDGDYSVAEGMSTIASSEYQHVQGKYNIEDSSNTYAHIVGNGTKITARSNAHTLDWSGNAWYAGKVSIGTTSNVPTPTDVNDLVTKQYVDNKFSTKTTSVTLAADSWTTSGNKFKYTYSNTSLRASVSPIITCTSNEKEYGYIADAEATANTGIVFTANKKPTSNIILTIIDIG